MRHRGRHVDLAAITDVALLAVEGERDDISGLGQTKAALKHTVNLPESNKKYLMARRVGHNGIFNGRRWREEIAPGVEKFITTHNRGGSRSDSAVFPDVERTSVVQGTRG